MARFANVGVMTASVLLALQCSFALADAAPPVDESQTDWLIEQHGGQWEVVSKGPRGRVLKVYPNQEVLRPGEGGSLVDVVSMPAMNEDQEVSCSQRARRDARDQCSSHFLACKPAPGYGIVSTAMFLFGATDSATDYRNRLSCRMDVDAILAAAKSVEMIQRIPPVEVVVRQGLEGWITSLWLRLVTP